MTMLTPLGVSGVGKPKPVLFVLITLLAALHLLIQVASWAEVSYLCALVGLEGGARIVSIAWTMLMSLTLPTLGSSPIRRSLLYLGFDAGSCPSAMFSKALRQIDLRVTGCLHCGPGGLLSLEWAPLRPSRPLNLGLTGFPQISMGSSSGPWTPKLFLTTLSSKSSGLGRLLACRLGPIGSERISLPTLTSGFGRTLFHLVRTCLQTQGLPKDLGCWFSRPLLMLLFGRHGCRTSAGKGIQWCPHKLFSFLWRSSLQEAFLDLPILTGEELHHVAMAKKSTGGGLMVGPGMKLSLSLSILVCGTSSGPATIRICW